jgi:predicted Zn-dependent protease
MLVLRGGEGSRDGPGEDSGDMAEPNELAFIKLADAYCQEGLSADAIRLCRDGLKAHPNSVRGRVSLVRALLSGGMIEEAAVELSRARALSPVDSEVLAAAREIEIARTTKTDAPGPEQPDPLASQTLASLYATQGDEARATEILKTVAGRRRQAHLDLLLAYRRAVQAPRIGRTDARG